MNCFDRSNTVIEDNDKIDASVSRTALSIWQRFGRRTFLGKTFAFCAQTIASVTCQQIKENAPTHDFVDKSICEERRPPLN